MDPGVLWAEIHSLRDELRGPPGYASWKDAAIAERCRRVAAEKQVDRSSFAGCIIWVGDKAVAIAMTDLEVEQAICPDVPVREMILSAARKILDSPTSG